MSAPNNPPKPAGGDPAMDDILASIRRILNEDEAPSPTGPQPQAGGAPPPGNQPPPAEPLELTEAMMVQRDADARDGRPAPAEPEPEAPDPQSPPALGPDALMAPTVAAATTATVGKLLRAVAQERSAPVHRGGPTIEDVVREELRPLLKEWLDQHLPPLVERLVRAEIERVVGRAL
jgi:cell pole-organizing protein PopZ